MRPQPRCIRVTAGDEGRTVGLFWMLTEHDLLAYLKRAHAGEPPDDLMLAILLDAGTDENHS